MASKKEDNVQKYLKWIINKACYQRTLGDNAQTRYKALSVRDKSAKFEGLDIPPTQLKALHKIKINYDTLVGNTTQSINQEANRVRKLVEANRVKQANRSKKASNKSIEAPKSSVGHIATEFMYTENTTTSDDEDMIGNKSSNALHDILDDHLVTEPRARARAVNKSNPQPSTARSEEDASVDKHTNNNNNGGALRCTPNCDSFKANGDSSAYYVPKVIINGNSDSDAYIDCDGDSSCEGVGLTGTNIKGIKCGGDRSCFASEMKLDCIDPCKIECDGDKSCKNAKFTVTNVESMSCGDAACVQSDPDDDFQLECGAEKSCRAANIRIVVNGDKKESEPQQETANNNSKQGQRGSSQAPQMMSYGAHSGDIVNERNKATSLSETEDGSTFDIDYIYPNTDVQQDLKEDNANDSDGYEPLAFPTSQFPDGVLLYEPVHFCTTRSVEGDSYKIIYYKWDFGDGTIATTYETNRIQHAYQKTGFFFMQLTVMDAAGRTSTSDMIQRIYENPRFIASTTSDEHIAYIMANLPTLINYPCYILPIVDYVDLLVDYQNDYHEIDITAIPLDTQITLYNYVKGAMRAIQAPEVYDE